MYISDINNHNYKAIGYLMYIGFTQDDNGKWNYYGYEDNVFENIDFGEIGLIYSGKLTVKFGHVNGEFSLRYYDYLDSLEGCPDSCDKFTLNTNIYEIDYLPDAQHYYLSECNIQKILHVFKDHVEYLDLSYNSCLNTFVNFPKSCGVLNISSTKIKTLEGIPIIFDILHIEHLEINSLKGLEEMNFNSLYAHCSFIKNLEYCPILNYDIDLSNSNIKSLKGLKGTLKREIVLRSCNIEDLSYLDSVNTEKLNVSQSTLKSFDSFKGKAEELSAYGLDHLINFKIDFSQFKKIQFGSNNVSLYDIIKSGLPFDHFNMFSGQLIEDRFINNNIDVQKLDNISKNEYFERLLTYLIKTDYSKKDILSIRWSDEYLEKVENIFKSKESTLKYNL